MPAWAATSFSNFLADARIAQENYYLLNMKNAHSAIVDT